MYLFDKYKNNTFEVVNQLSINTQNSYHRYDVILLINGVPMVQIELKALDTSPRRAMQQIEQIDFEFVLFASAVIDYDYIMGLISRYSQGTPQKQKMTREQLVGLLSSTANFMDERAEMIAYIDTLKVGEGLNEKTIRQGYEAFKSEKFTGQLAQTAQGRDISGLAAYE